MPSTAGLSGIADVRRRLAKSITDIKEVELAILDIQKDRMHESVTGGVYDGEKYGICSVEVEKV